MMYGNMERYSHEAFEENENEINKVRELGQRHPIHGETPDADPGDILDAKLRYMQGRAKREELLGLAHEEALEENTRRSAEQLVEANQLFRGKNITLEKVAAHSSSKVSKGSILKGALQNDVRLGSAVEFESGARTSAVHAIEKRDGEVLLRTETSTYRLVRENSEEEMQKDIAFDDIASVETARGSEYRYLPDGTTQRYKKVEDREYEPQQALVYVPDYEWVQKHAPENILKILGDNEVMYNEILLDYVHNPRNEKKKTYIIDNNGKVVETNEAIRNAEKPVHLAFYSKGEMEFSIPIFHTPQIGFHTFDVRRYTDEDTGREMREKHLGNKVVKIVTKGDEGVEDSNE